MAALVKRGHGRFTQGGGNNPTFVTITNNNPLGTGSLAAFLEDDANDGPRQAVLLFSGTTTLTRDLEVVGECTYDVVDSGHFLMHRNYRVQVVESEVILRGMIARISSDSNARNSDDRDGISIGKQPARLTNVIIDRCSISWTGDEALTIWGPNSDMTLSNNIVAEPMLNSGHTKGSHGMGLLIGKAPTETYSPRRISCIGNLISDADYRSPLAKDGLTELEYINNVTYNPGVYGMDFIGTSTANIINNIVKHGPDTSNNNSMFRLSSSNSYYVTGNKRIIGDTYSDLAPDNSGGVKTVPTFTGPTTSFEDAGQDTFEYVLANAGANPVDNIDLRIKEEVRNGTGGLIDHPNDTGNAQDGFGFGYIYPGVVAPPPTPTKQIFYVGSGAVVPKEVSLAGNTQYDISIAAKNTKGTGPKSNNTRVTTLAVNAATPTVVETWGNNQWTFQDIEDIVWPVGHATGDLLIGLFSVRGNSNPTGGSFATFLSGFDGFLVNYTGGGSTEIAGNEVHTAIAYKFATSNNMPNIVPRDNTGDPTNNITSSLYTLVRGAGNPVVITPNKLMQPRSTTVSHAGGTTVANDLTLWTMNTTFDSLDNQISNAAVTNGSNLSLKGFEKTTAGAGSQSYLWSAKATDTTQSFTATASNALLYNMCGIRIPAS